MPWLPAGINAKNEWRQAVGHVVDIAPTILTLAGGQWPAEYATRRVLPSPGKNLAGTFKENVPIDRRAVWWLHEGNRSIRVGNWKLVSTKNEPWELYDLNMDRTETSNLAEESQDRVQQLSKLWEDHVAEFNELRNIGYQPE